MARRKTLKEINALTEKLKIQFPDKKFRIEYSSGESEFHPVVVEYQNLTVSRWEDGRPFVAWESYELAEIVTCPVCGTEWRNLVFDADVRPCPDCKEDQREMPEQTCEDATSLDAQQDFIDNLLRIPKTLEWRGINLYPDTWALGRLKGNELQHIQAIVERQKNGYWHWHLINSRMFHLEKGNAPNRILAMDDAEAALKEEADHLILNGENFMATHVMVNMKDENDFLVPYLVPYLHNMYFAAKIKADSVISLNSITDSDEADVAIVIDGEVSKLYPLERETPELKQAAQGLLVDFTAIRDELAKRQSA